MTDTPAGLTFDLFGTLVAVDRPADPALAVGDALGSRGVSVPSDWPAAYRESHCDVPEGRELSLTEHVRAALASREVTADREPVASAVRDAFDQTVRTRPGAVRAVEAAAACGPVGVLSNCSVPGLVQRTLERSDIDDTALEAVVASVDCGYRKPHPRAFEAAADSLGLPIERVLHVGDDPTTDGGATDAGATALLLADVSLSELPDRLGGEV